MLGNIGVPMRASRLESTAAGDSGARRRDAKALPDVSDVFSPPEELCCEEEAALEFVSNPSEMRLASLSLPTQQ
ncbi:hypothetical protein SRHO_G00018680 [Serrasalmus rhombeus]